MKNRSQIRSIAYFEALALGTLFLISCERTVEKTEAKEELEQMGAQILQGEVVAPGIVKLDKQQTSENLPTGMSRKPYATPAPPATPANQSGVTAQQPRTASSPSVNIVPHKLTLGAQNRSVNVQNFAATTKEKGKLTMVVFSATWCGPCRRMKPEIAAVVNQVPSNVNIARVDVDTHKKLARQCGVRGIPDVQFYVDGKKVGGFVGGRKRGYIKDQIMKYAPKQVATAVRGFQR